MIVHPDMCQVNRHVRQGGVPSGLEKPDLIGGVELQQGRPELKSLRPLGPASRRVLAVDGVDGSPGTGISVLLELIQGLSRDVPEPVK